ncbi:gp43 [Bacillus phage G]|uniref:Gp43 n=1 Tax=Bacillus phage G TaxID=2884420 RepID=G3MBB3_9CAUD|nr:gp43 [Bacillus phage G]AEO93314.1 gp43 [Bacillus phage G]
MLENKNEEELIAIKDKYLDEVRDLQRLIDEKRKSIREIDEQLQRKHVWYVYDVVSTMLEQLELNKNRISDNSYWLLQREIKSLLLTNATDSKFYKRGKIVKNIYFNFKSLIVMKLSEYDLITKRFTYSPVYRFQFSFDELNNKIDRKFTSNIFSKHSKRFCDFVVPIENLSGMNKEVIKLTKSKYDDYKDIMNDIILVTQYIENEMEARFLACKLNQ